MWIFRLGEFFQRRVSQAAAAVAPVLERPRAARAIPSPPPSWATPRDQALFTPEAEQVMQQWPQRAPFATWFGNPRASSDLTTSSTATSGSSFVDGLVDTRASVGGGA